MGVKMLSPKKAYMVLLAAEHGEEGPDSGAQEVPGMVMSFHYACSTYLSTISVRRQGPTVSGNNP